MRSIALRRNKMPDEEKQPEEEVVEEEETKEEEAVEEPAEEKEEKAEETEETEEAEEESAEEEEKRVEALGVKIAQIIDTQLKASDEKKKKALSAASKVSIKDTKVKLFTTQKGEKVELEKSKVDALGEYMRSIMLKDYSGARKWRQKLEPLNVTTGADGGTLVPTVLSNILVPLLEDKAVIRGLSTVLQVPTDALDLPIVDTKPLAAWSGVEQLTADKATSSMQFDYLTLTPYTLAVVVTLTNQLVEDSPFNIVKIVSQAMAESIVRVEEQAFAIGSGVGQPTGFSTYGFGTTNAGGALAYNHVNTAFYTMPQAYRDGAVWIANGRAIELLTNMVDSNNQPIMRIDHALYNGLPTMRGKPIYECNALGQDDIYLVNFKYYYIGDKHGIRMKVSEDATVGTDSGGNSVNLFMRNMMALRLEKRTDGEFARLQAAHGITNIR